MDTPGGVIVRPPMRNYNPTFWPFQHFAHIQDDGKGRGLAVLQTMPGAISYQSDGNLELVALRNATREKAFGFIGIPGNPASGHERTSYAFDYALMFTQSGDWYNNDIHLIERSIQYSPWEDSQRPLLSSLVAAIVTTDCLDIQVMAVKPASRGEGVIVRLYTPTLPKLPLVVNAHHFMVREAFLCDARERDLKPLEVKDGNVIVKMPGAVATIRMLFG